MYSPLRRDQLEDIPSVRLDETLLCSGRESATRLCTGVNCSHLLSVGIYGLETPKVKFLRTRECQPRLGRRIGNTPRAGGLDG